MTEFSSNLTFDKQETVVLASRVAGGSASESDPLDHALRATSIDLVVEARSSAGGSLALVAQESDDGESWLELDAIGTLTRTGSASLTVTPAKEWLRVAWSGGGGWTLDIAATGHATIEAGNIGTGGGGSQPISLLGPYRVAFDTTGITGRHQVGPDLANGSAVLIAYAVPTASNNGLWAGDVGDITLTIGMEDADEWDSLTIYNVSSGAYATLPSEYQHGQSDAGSNVDTHYRLVGVVRAGTGHIYVTAGDDNLDAPTIGEADIYALVYTPA